MAKIDRNASRKIQEFQDGRTSWIRASYLVKFTMFARLLRAISTHIVCLDVDHRLLLAVTSVIKSSSSQPMKEFLRLRSSMQMGWVGRNGSKSGLTCYLDRYKFEICNTLCLLFQLSSSCSRYDNTINE